MADEELLARISALEDTVRDLRGELARARVGGFKSMRDARRCPACGGEALLHIPEAQEVLHSSRLAPIAVHHVPGFFGMKTFGKLEYYVCRTCLLIESHVQDLEGVIPDGKAIIEIVPELPPPNDGPFR